MRSFVGLPLAPRMQDTGRSLATEVALLSLTRGARLYFFFHVCVNHEGAYYSLSSLERSSAGKRMDPPGTRREKDLDVCQIDSRHVGFPRVMAPCPPRYPWALRFPIHNAPSETETG